MVLLQEWFWVEGIEVRGAAVEKDVDDVFGLAFEVGVFGGHGVE